MLRNGVILAIGCVLLAIGVVLETGNAIVLAIGETGNAIVLATGGVLSNGNGIALTANDVGISNAPMFEFALTFLLHFDISL